MTFEHYKQDMGLDDFILLYGREPTEDEIEEYEDKDEEEDYEEITDWGYQTEEDEE